MRILDEARQLYAGGLLKLVKECVESCGVKHPICNEKWFQRNAYLDDICASPRRLDPPTPWDPAMGPPAYASSAFDRIRLVGLWPHTPFDRIRRTR